MPLEYVFTGFENASPVEWSIADDGHLDIEMIYDHERLSPNRAVLHWHVQLQATTPTDLRVVMSNFDNIWNGHLGSPIQERTSCCVSEDGQTWRVIQGRKCPGNVLELNLHVETGRLFLARIEPYRLSDLERFLDRVQRDSRVELKPVGKTVEGRELEILRVGDPTAPFSVLIRARAHPWETGGSWLLEGLAERLLQADPAGAAPRYCLYAMPMANKDGVVRGGSRFNLMGMDLNRKWDRPADPDLAPENHALEQWLAHVAADEGLPNLAIDLHNDASGRLHVSRPAANAEPYLADMARFEEMLREHTWFTEGSTGANFSNPGSFGEGLFERFGIPACILELNCNWSAGLDKAPLGVDWRLMGEQMHDALESYFANV